MEALTKNIGELESAQRWDFDFHGLKYARVMNSLGRVYPVAKLGEIITLLTDMGAFSLYKTEFFVDSGIPFLRVQNVQEYGVDLARDTKYITREYHEQLKKSQLQPDDLLITTKAVIGVSTVVEPGLGECNMSQNLVRIRLIDGINPRYIAAFLNSRLGRTQTVTAATGPNQKYLNFRRIRDVKIALPTRKAQDTIAKIMQDAYATRRKKQSDAEKLLTDIETFVLKKLGVNVTTNQRQRAIIKPISQIAGGRFDFEAVAAESSLNFTGHAPTVLNTIVEQITDRIFPPQDYPNENVNYISLGHIVSNTGELVDFAPVKGADVLSSSVVFKQGDILFGRMRPYLNKVWLAEFDGICTGEAIVFRPDPKKVDTVFLHALLMSQITLMQVIPFQSGTSLPRVSASHILGVKLPIPESIDRQKEIASEITRCRAKAKRLRVEAEQIVTEAKAKVERLILGETLE